MQIPFTEPTAPRYIYINPDNNQVHLMMPVVSGTEIGLDNTCKSVSSLQEFFGKSKSATQRAALDELAAYKKALELDLSLIASESEVHVKKRERFEQITRYIEALERVQKSDALQGLSQGFSTYPEPLKSLMRQEDSNLYAMVLRPTEMDSFLRFERPVFSVKRNGDSPLYKSLQNAYQSIDWTVSHSAEARLISAVVAALKKQPFDFEELREVLAEKIKEQLGVLVNFHKTDVGLKVGFKDVTKEFIYITMVYDGSETSQNYIDVLLAFCAPNLFDISNEPPFYGTKTAEELSIVTQFFLGVVNIHCAANKRSSVDFGRILDGSKDLSTTLAKTVALFFKKGSSIEDALLHFVNKHSKSFQLTTQLTASDMTRIKKQFIKHFTEIRKSPHFDEFILLDTSKPGLFFTHQGSICVDFAEFLSKGIPELVPEYAQAIQADYKALRHPIPNTNPCVHSSIELSIDELLSKIHTEEQLAALLKKLPKAQREEINVSPQMKRLQVPKFLHHVAKGEQNEAESLLKANPDEQFLMQSGPFTDYSGRTFDCTAYEYAYWAKDTYMRSMLERYMDEETKAEMSKRCDVMERDGLAYLQNGEVKNSKHYDLTPLITALDAYVKGYDTWHSAKNLDAIKAAWIKVGQAQCDVPANVAHEYCMAHRSFDPLPSFKELTLPRCLTFYNFDTDEREAWFPLGLSGSSGLGVDFAVYLAPGGASGIEWVPRGPRGRRALAPLVDLAAISHLDTVRTEELTLSRENLKPGVPEHGLDNLMF